MQPIGTITMYFPFLDEETRNLMQSLMEKASNYYDFVMRLNRRALTESVPVLAVYFALHHSALLLDMDSIEAIGQRYGKLTILRPNLFYARVFQGNPSDAAKVHEAADIILNSNPPDWLAIEMRFLKFEVDLLHYPGKIYDTANLNELESLIKKSHDYCFFDNIYHDCIRERAMRDGDIDEVLRRTELAIESAERSNDLVRLAYHLRTKADYLQTTDLTEAKDALTKARELMLSLGNKAGLASTIHYLSRIDAIRGEYNLSIERNLEVVEMRESMNLPRGAYAILLSTLYNTIGHPDAGLEWARLAEVDFGSHPGFRPRAILNQAWSLVLLNRRPEAWSLIDSIRKTILQTGMETILAWLFFVVGVYDMASGDFDSAAENIEEASKLYEGKPFVEHSIIFLYHLALLDVLKLKSSSFASIDAQSTKWLVILEEKARSDNLPGILGQALLLKAQLALLHNDDDLLREAVNGIHELGSNPSMQFLNESLESILKKA